MLLATKPMQLAQYFCTYIAPDPLDWRHYALAVGHYTHFTSPIRSVKHLQLLVCFLRAASAWSVRSPKGVCCKGSCHHGARLTAVQALP
jgi:hypothetical protein